jgi:hypothetical protein
MQNKISKTSIETIKVTSDEKGTIYLNNEYKVDKVLESSWHNLKKLSRICNYVLIYDFYEPEDIGENGMPKNSPINTVYREFATLEDLKLFEEAVNHRFAEDELLISLIKSERKHEI